MVAEKLWFSDNIHKKEHLQIKKKNKNRIKGDSFLHTIIISPQALSIPFHLSLKHSR